MTAAEVDFVKFLEAASKYLLNLRRYGKLQGLKPHVPIVIRSLAERFAVTSLYHQPEVDCKKVIHSS